MLRSLLFLTYLSGQQVPFIRTTFNLDDKNGFCIGVAFWSGKLIYDLVQLRECNFKHGNETIGNSQQVMFWGSGSISIENGEKCLEEVSHKGGPILIFRSCWSQMLAQNFSLDPNGCLIKNIQTGHCLAVSSTASNSGFWRSRELKAVECSSVDKKLLSWNIYPQNSGNKLDCEKPGRGNGLPNWAAVLLTILVIAICIFAFWLQKKWKDRQRSFRAPRGPVVEQAEFNVLQCPAGHKLKHSVLVVTERRWCDFCDETRLYEGIRVYACVKCNWIICSSCYHRRDSAPSNPNGILLVTSPGRRGELRTVANMVSPPKPPPVKKKDLRGRIQEIIGIVTKLRSYPPKRENIAAPERIGREINQIKLVLSEVTNLQRHHREYRRRSYSPSTSRRNYSPSTSLSLSSSRCMSPRRIRGRYDYRDSWS